MKKFLAVAPIVLLLSACATNAPMNNHSRSSFTCEDSGQVMAIYSNSGQVANLNINLPKIGLSHKNITLNQAVSGSGARYINNSDAKVSYDWHTKADYGIMSIRMKNGQEYSVNCKI